jgi:hypothetical protein
MIDYSNAGFYQVSVHTVGNKTNGDELLLSQAPLPLSEGRLHALMFKFFLQSFVTPEYFSFTFSNEDFTLNPIYQFVTGIFEDETKFHAQSRNMAKHLYELSTHPQIKSGDLFIAYMANIIVEDEQVDALGIFKSENKHAFLKLQAEGSQIHLSSEDGISIEKLDKGCLILNSDKESGYRVLILDKSNKTSEAQYWRDDFLQLTPRQDEYHQTREFMNITKNYVTKQITQDFEVSKADQIDLLNRSVEFFKSRDTFDKEEFETTVLQDKGIIQSFRSFDETYRETHDITLNDQFDISQQAVKKQSKVFKSVLKLDKNFHIYIHGNRDLIEQGVEKDGRKYYKIYFEEEG